MRGPTSRRLTRITGIVLSVLLLVAGIVLPFLTSVDETTFRLLGVFLFVIVLWITKSVPYTISSVIAVTMLLALGVAETFEEAGGGFASNLVFFLFLLLLLGKAISKVGLDERAAERLLSIDSTPRKTVRSFSTNLYLLSFFMPSALARAVAFIPILDRIRDTYNVKRGSNFDLSSFFVLGHVNPIASMSLMTGGGMAITTSEIIRSSVRPVTWVGWAVFMIPPVFVLYALSAYAAERIYPVNDRKTVEDTSTSNDLTKSVTEDDHGAEPMSRNEWIVLVVMTGTLLLWIVGSFAGIPTIVPAALAVGFLAAPTVGVITTDEVRDMNWGILFIIGTMFSILDLMDESGTLALIVDSITQLVPFGAMATWQIIAVFLAIAIVIRAFFSTASAAIIVVLPIVLEFAQVLGINQFYLALSILITIGSTTFLPFNTTTVLLSYDQGPLSARDVFLFGCITMICSIGVILFTWLFYWPLVDSVVAF